MHNGWRYLVTLWVLVVVCACGTPPITPAAPAPTATPVNAPTTLVVWHAMGGSNEVALRDVFNQIAVRYGFRVILQRIPITTIQTDVANAFAQSQGPHIVVLSSTQLQAILSNDCCLAIDTLLAVATRDALTPQVLATVQGANQQLYGLPISYELPVLYYRMQSVLSAPNSSDDLLSIAHSLRNPPQWGLGIDLSMDSMYGYLSAFGGEIIDARGTVVLGGSGRAGSEAWLRWLTMLNNDPLLLTRLDAVFRIERTLGAGQLEMVVDSSKNHQTYTQLWGAATGIAPLPVLSITNQMPRPLLTSTVLVLNKHLSVAELVASRQLLNALISTDIQQQLLGYGLQPVNRQLSLADTPHGLAIQNAAVHAVQPHPALMRYDVYAVLRTMVRQVVVGAQSPADAITTADQQIRLLIEGSPTP
ncbi:MAG: extracellular solute-binding protein [Roseiflexaceae bacterium]|jgi:maltose-binding protein MalE